MRKMYATNLLVLFIASFFFAPLRLCASNTSPIQDVSVEVFQVFELPLNVHEALLIKSDKSGYSLKLSLANSSDQKIIGLRYSLVSIDAENKVRFRVNRTEGFSIAPYKTKSLTFKTPIRFKSNGERLVLMLEQVISRESIWEVVKAKEAFDAYAKGDYSVMPVVLKVPNQVDAPVIPGRPIN
ncbi:MAG TPA: hypothetical protein VFU83_08095 [Pyrinomonadaceae bacterium]|nr:hypothetical protein [Pyrinomonadaceae bacterium]